MAQRMEEPFSMVFNFLSALDLPPAMQTSAQWLSTLDLVCEVRLAVDFQRDDVGDVFQGRPKLAKVRPSLRFVEFHRMIRASVKRLEQLLDEMETLDSMSTQTLLLLKPLQNFVYNALCGAPAWPFGCSDPLTLELEPGKPRTYFQSLTSYEQRTPWNVAEIGDISTFAPSFEASQLLNLLLRLGWLDDQSQSSGQTVRLEAHNDMFTFLVATPSVCSELQDKRIFEDNLMIGKLFIPDIDEAHLSGFIGLEFALYDAVSWQQFGVPVEEGSRVSPCYHMILSVAAFPRCPLFPQKLENQHHHLAENVPEELTRFIWMNFGSVPFDDLLIASTAIAWGIEPYTVLDIGEFLHNHLADYHPHESPYWNYKVCGHELFSSKGALARWVRNVLRWHQLEFRRVQSLPNFPRQTYENYMAFNSRDFAR